MKDVVERRSKLQQEPGKDEEQGEARQPDIDCSAPLICWRIGEYENEGGPNHVECQSTQLQQSHAHEQALSCAIYDQSYSMCAGANSTPRLALVPTCGEAASDRAVAPRASREPTGA